MHIVSESGRARIKGSGAIDHIAFRCHGLMDTLELLKKDGVAHELRQVPAARCNRSSSAIPMA